MSNFWEDLKEVSLAVFETVQDYIKDFWTAIHDGWIIIALLIAALILTISFANPPPPKEVVLASGPKGTSYYELGESYAKELKKSGINVILKDSKGFEDNINQLENENNSTQVAFIVSGVGEPTSKKISSLGSIQYAPLWLFYKGNFTPSIKVNWINGKNVYIGDNGTATKTIATKILALDDLTRGANLIIEPYSKVIDSIDKNQLDVIFIMDQENSETIQFLANSPDWHMSTITRYEAFKKIIPYLHILKVPEGSLSLKFNKPEEDISILSGTVDIAVKDNLHPAIQMLFIEAAKKINGQETFFSKQDEFPSYKNSTIKESNEAKIYYERGLPRLMGILPFWLAEMISRLLFFILPFLVIAYPVLKSLPGLKLKRCKTRIGKAYVELKRIEKSLTNNDTNNYEQELQDIETLEKDVKTIKVPSKLTSDYFSLLSAIDFLRNLILRYKDTTL